MRRLPWTCLIPLLVLGACGDDSQTTPEAETAAIEITALAGPTCAVETNPPSPECAPRPVGGAVMVVADADGTEVARGTTDADGAVTIEVTAGDLTVIPQPVDGLLGTAPPIEVTVLGNQTVQLTADYDTGIR